MQSPAHGSEGGNWTFVSHVICVHLTSHAHQGWHALDGVCEFSPPKPLGRTHLPLVTSLPCHLSPQSRCLAPGCPWWVFNHVFLSRLYQPKSPAPSEKTTVGRTGSEARLWKKNVLKGRKDIKGNHRSEALIHSDRSLVEVSTGCWQMGMFERCGWSELSGNLYQASGLS